MSWQKFITEALQRWDWETLSCPWAVLTLLSAPHRLPQWAALRPCVLLLPDALGWWHLRGPLLPRHSMQTFLFWDAATSPSSMWRAGKVMVCSKMPQPPEGPSPSLLGGKAEDPVSVGLPVSLCPWLPLLLSWFQERCPVLLWQIWVLWSSSGG